jgi:hypothetical protein
MIIDEYELGILFVKSHTIIVWNVNDQKIRVYNFRTITIEKTQQKWQVYAFSWENQEEAYIMEVKNLEIRYE